MPWKGEPDPYKIWVSEIILQQTQVAQGIAYYHRFITKYPTVQDLASAKDHEVFKIWEGLGYYSRCKNMLTSARLIMGEMNNNFPTTYKELLLLPGVGSYTASAIASFAYNLPHAVLDGNVFRVLSRFFGIESPIDSSSGKKVFTELADSLLDKSNARMYNQAIMDFGATVCRPLPLCPSCPLNKKCIAYLNSLTTHLPVKGKQLVRKERWMYFLVIEYQGKVYVRRRNVKDIWQNLYEFVLVENSQPVSLETLRLRTFFSHVFGDKPFCINNISPVQRQLLTHQVISGRFIAISLKNPLSYLDYELVSKNQLRKLPFPKYITTYLDKINVSLK